MSSPAAHGPNGFVGGLGNDTLIGVAGSDVLDGGLGADHLSGGPGADRLLGGTGRDLCSQGTGSGSLGLADRAVREVSSLAPAGSGLWTPLRGCALGSEMIEGPDPRTRNLAPDQGVSGGRYRT
jgi:hypothetical protein